MSTVDRCKIYGLFDKLNPERVRYVGQTTLPLIRRLTLHKYQSKNTMKHTPVGKWIRSRNGNIGIKLLQANAAWNKAEIRIIRKARKKEPKLLNVTDGGMGRLNTELSEAHRAKISAALKGKKKTKEHAKNISLGHLGKKVSEETKQRLRAANLGKTSPRKGIRISNEARDYIALARGGKPFDVYDLKTGRFLGTWINQKRCAEMLGISDPGVNRGLKVGKTKKFKFVKRGS